MSILKLTNGVNIPARSITRYRKLQNGATVLHLTDGSTIEVHNLEERKIISLIESATSMQAEADSIQRNVELAVRKQQEVISNSLSTVIDTNADINTAMYGIAQTMQLMTTTINQLQKDLQDSKSKHELVTTALESQSKKLTNAVDSLNKVTLKLKEFVGD